MEFIKFINQYQGFFYVILTFVNICIFGLILWVTIKYARSTKEIAEKTAESVEASKGLSKTTVDLRKDELTYKLIREWTDDKKYLTYHSKKLGIDGGDVLESAEEFIDHFNNFVNYFSLVEKLINYNNINKDLYFKILSKEIVNFKYEEFDKNADAYSLILRNLRDNLKINLPIVSDREGFDRICKIAEEEYKDYIKFNY